MPGSGRPSSRRPLGGKQMNKTELLNKLAQSGEERLLFARTLDKLEQCRQRNIPVHTPFLSPAERAGIERLIAAAGHPRHLFWGGYSQAERTVCLFLPDWLEEETALADPDGPVTALRCTFSKDAPLTHRDFLGSLMGLGITREKLGDFLVGPGSCDVLVLADACPILLSQWEEVGRYRVSCRPLALTDLSPAPVRTKLIRDTVATLRLDAVAASAFSLSRGRAADLISAGRISLNHRECTKGDRLVAQGDVLTCRGLGKCLVKTVGGPSKKGRIMIELERYL